MEYISSEEFLNQPKEVQKIFMDWWKPSMRDLVHNRMSRNDILSISTPSWLKDIDGLKEYFYPLFTEGQLRKFIEDKTGGKVFLTYGRDKTYTIFIGYGSKGVFHTEILLDSNESDLLQAYWEVACKIAEKEIEKEGK